MTQKTQSPVKIYISPVKIIEDSLVHLSACCDGSRVEDNVGFNKIDSAFGKDLARKVIEGVELSNNQLIAAHKMLTKYAKTQLKKFKFPSKEQLLDFISTRKDNKVNNPAGMSKEIKTKKVVTKEYPNSYFTSDRTVDWEKGQFIIRFRFNYQVLGIVKQLPKAKFIGDNEDDKYWIVPNDYEDEQLKIVYQALVPLRFTFSQNIINYLKNKEEQLKRESEEIADRYECCKSYFKSVYKSWKIKPYVHQWVGARFIINQPNMRAIISDDMGLGKSIQSLMAANGLRYWLIESGEASKVYVIVVCPVSVQQNWIREAAKLNMNIEVYSSSKLPSPPNRDYILILDESHYFKTYKAKRTKDAMALAANDHCKSAILLTGTPMKNGRPAELYTQLKMVGHPIARDKKGFEKKYCSAKATRFCQWDTTGASNLDTLNERIKDKVLRRTKEECLDLPPRTFIDVEAEEIKDAEIEYQDKLEELKADYYHRVELGLINDTAQAIVFLNYFRRLASLYKSYHTINMIKDFVDRNEPIIVFTEFVESAKKIADHFGVTPITGEVNTKKRQQIIDDFQSGINNVFVGTIKSCGAGITLTRSAYTIMNDQTWNCDTNQAHDRNYRVGQDRKVFVYTVFGKDIDYVIARMLDNKSENINAVLSDLDISVPKQPDAKFYTDLLKKLIAKS